MIIFMLDEHSFSFSAGLGHATNNFNEFMALKLTLQLDLEKGITNMNVYGDSMLIIRCMNEMSTLQNCSL